MMTKLMMVMKCWFGTNPLGIDTDNDGLEDGREILVNGTDPLHNDTDDGLEDGAKWSTSPTRWY